MVVEGRNGDCDGDKGEDRWGRSDAVADRAVTGVCDLLRASLGQSSVVEVLPSPLDGGATASAAADDLD